MTITVGATGTYSCTFSASGKGSSVSGIYYYAFHVNGSVIAHSEREIEYGAAQADGTTNCMATQMITGLVTSDTLTIQWYRSNTGTYTVHERSMQIIKIA